MGAGVGSTVSNVKVGARVMVTASGAGVGSTVSIGIVIGVGSKVSSTIVGASVAAAVVGAGVGSTVSTAIIRAGAVPVVNGEAPKSWSKAYVSKLLPRLVLRRGLYNVQDWVLPSLKGRGLR